MHLYTFVSLRMQTQEQTCTKQILPFTDGKSTPATAKSAHLLRPWRSVDDDLPTSPLKFHVRRLGHEISFQANDAIGRGVDDVVPTFGRHGPWGG